jgi:hypothetical protein
MKWGGVFVKRALIADTCDMTLILTGRPKRTATIVAALFLCPILGCEPASPGTIELIKVSKPTPVPAPPPPRIGTIWGPTIQNWRLQLSTDHTTYLIGQPITVTVTLQNLDSRRRNAGNGGGFEMEFSFDITLPNGEKAPQTRRRELPMAYSRSFLPTLDAGEAGSDNFSELTTAYDMTLPGEYTIVVHHDLPDDLLPGKIVKITSNVVSIALKPAQ